MALTQCTDIVSNSLHHKVSRFTNNASFQSRTPGPHLLLASLGANLDLHGTKQSIEWSVTMTSWSQCFVCTPMCTCVECAVLPRWWWWNMFQVWWGNTQIHTHCLQGLSVYTAPPDPLWTRCLCIISLIQSYFIILGRRKHPQSVCSETTNNRVIGCSEPHLRKQNHSSE